MVSIEEVALGIAGLLPTSDEKDDKRIGKALEHLGRALNSEFWDDADRVNNYKVFKELREAVKELMKVETVDVSESINALVALEAEDVEYDKAIDHYKKAWKYAKKAV